MASEYLPVKVLHEESQRMITAKFWVINALSYHWLISHHLSVLLDTKFPNMNRLEHQ